MTTTLGLILAGGQARRMGGGDKALLRVGGSTILDRTLERFAPQCADTIINANGDPARFDFTGLTIVPDDVPGSAGPLAGILAGLDWCAAHRPDIEFVASVSGDCPFLPTDLVRRLHAVREAENKPLACAQSGEWRHPTIALWRVDLRSDLRHALVDDDLRKIEVWTARHGVAIASWPDKPTDPFFNVNTPEDLRAAEALIGEQTI
ncbi:molybdenum cofactor guanylyltransferase [Variibacter gotjawalensis]|uniref:Molybdenum cofactor guanylyltransferase n=1 Tax=Variibacter gotjawalensis TaxID=1333996 RepID=A0A0S3PWW5_9BRAD|nr:molybdenum cofactor guanylyltransferase MobA [Variibacter gotjawalensis]NIK46215.1 molybdopterin-guanine dinucleotide biosynthesis protein A [Variibacter gotjawalensis]RZS48131.1 molybdenum cofactor guanylyltransferase [Variibacter gotjawalensis]BAT60388.1 molybdenum cofactor guanylyltransferase [Variibacter gotjawalensis]